ncbi:AraC family transcriptional regulator [Paenibacillus cymbidii]|uniref:AraC family transcriptional regulator n=1 Tax=Paenibacillus cymbidii TaxID=1639034 RepID=UPI0010813E46|nr:helix-turn-helix domain-containing protein [Paenibacillus cymbidii]
MQELAALRTRSDLRGLDVKINRNRGDWKMVWEWHDHIELMYVLSGSGKCCIGNDVHTFERGHLFVIGPKTRHKSEMVDRGGFDALIVLLHVGLGQAWCNEGFEHALDAVRMNYADHPRHFILNGARVARFESILDTMHEEYASDKTFSSQYVTALLQQLLIEVNRLCDEVVEANAANAIDNFQMPPVIAEIIGYIQQDYKENLRLSQIAAKFHLNPSHLSRQFKSATGMTLTAFITVRRIQHARRLLLTSNRTITEIALESGFHNLSYFNAMFKRMIGMSPKLFQKHSGYQTSRRINGM